MPQSARPPQAPAAAAAPHLMIYVATVHYRSPAWISIQRRELERTIGEPFQVYACLEEVPAHWSSSFDVVLPAKGDHGPKLDLLASAILQVADPDDLLLFLDGDAFPLRDPLPLVRRELETSALVAVRRDENDGERQPHPCFCAVRAKTWHDLHATWGNVWTDRLPDGRWRTDVGYNLLYTLESRGVPWTPLTRSNALGDPPLRHAVYGDLVYHHGAGFRDRAVSRADLKRRELSRQQLRVLSTRARKYLIRRLRRPLEAVPDLEADPVYRRIRDDPGYVERLGG